MRLITLALCLVAACAAQALEAPQAVAPRIEQLKAMLSDAPTIPEGYLHADFLKAVPADQVLYVLKKFHSDVGTITAVEITEVVSAHKVKLRIHTSKDMIFPAVIGVAATPPFQVNALWFGAAAPALKTVEEAVAKIKALGAGVSMSLYQIKADGDLEPIARHQGEIQRAIGSTFKLYILGALIDAVAAGHQSWDDQIRLKAAWKSWPSGVLHEWPEGTPLSLQALASAMISVSDNTATDHLLFRLGRPAIEAQLKEMGAAAPEKTTPFLSTREMFLLKTRTHKETHLKAYLALEDAAAKRGYLQGTLGPIKRDDVKIDFGEVSAIETVEWFASTDDLCRAMAWLKAHTEAPEVAAGRALLGINGGVKFDKEDWAYVGYKGGSEPGVLNGTWLLQRKKDKAWFALSASWNDPKSAVKLEDLFGPMRGLIRLLGKQG